MAKQNDRAKRESFLQPAVPRPHHDYNPRGHTRRSFLHWALAGISAFFANRVWPKPTTAATASTPRTQTAPVVYLTPADAGYKAAKETYNGTISIQPKLIARCANEAGVQQAVQRAIGQKLPIAVKSGGHSFEGFSLNDDGLVIDVSPMRELKFDEKTGVLTAGAGCRIVDVNNFLLPRGRFLPSGSCDTVGLSGLTLGGGYGILSRKWGLTCDHLRAVRMIDGTGKIRDSQDDSELLWACKGGGNGHFGVVTQMTFQTRAVPKSFIAWKFRIYKLDEKRATDLLDEWFRATTNLPHDAFSAWVMNGTQVTILLTTTGNPADLAAVRKTLGAFSNKTTTGGPVPLAKALTWYYGDPGPVLFKNASAGYYKGIDDLRSALPGVFAEVLHVPGLIFQVNTLGGAIAEGEGAYPHRAFPYLGEQQAYWEAPSQAEKRIAAIQRVGEHITKAGITRHYANYPDLAFKDWATAYYGMENYGRMQKLKRECDPDNRVQHPQSVRLPK